MINNRDSNKKGLKKAREKKTYNESKEQVFIARTQMNFIALQIISYIQGI